MFIYGARYMLDVCIFSDSAPTERARPDFVPLLTLLFTFDDIESHHTQTGTRQPMGEIFFPVDDFDKGK